MTVSRLTSIACNIENAIRPDTFRDRIRHNQPDVAIALQAYRARDSLHRIGRDLGYAHHQLEGAEAKGIAMLVREDLKVREWRELKMDLEWHGPPSKGGRRHDPRTYPIVVLEKDGRIWRKAAVHLPTHNNPAAQAESLKRIFAWLARGDRSAEGDWNMEAHQLADAIRARGLDAELVSARTKVDHQIVADLRSRAERLDGPSGTHGWTKYVLTPKTRKGGNNG